MLTNFVCSYIIFVCSVIKRLRLARLYQKQQIEIVCLTSQPRDIPEVAILGLNVLALFIVAVFLAATIVEASGATYIYAFALHGLY